MDIGEILRILIQYIVLIKTCG